MVKTAVITGGATAGLTRKTASPSHAATNSPTGGAPAERLAVPPCRLTTHCDSGPCRQLAGK
jgi:hypothetical protein